MAEGPGRAPPTQVNASGPDAPDPLDALGDPQAVARDWITIWQSELAALASDREMQEHWVRLVGVWAEAANMAARCLPGLDPRARRAGDGDDHGAAGRAGAAAAAGTAAAMAAPDARDAAIQRLAERVEELERRLAEAGSGAVPASGDGGVGA